MNLSAKAVTANPTMGSDKHAPANRSIIQTLIESARRQEALIDILTAAVGADDETAIIEAARNLAANRPKSTQPPARKLGRKKKDSEP